MKWGAIWGLAADTFGKLPLEKFLVPKVDRRKELRELKGILGNARTQKIPEPVPATPPEPEVTTPRHLAFVEKEDRAKVRLEANPATTSNVSTKETVDYTNREIGKGLLLMAKHLSQRFRINDRVCDCLVAGTLVYNDCSPVTISQVGSRVLTHKGALQKVTNHMNRNYDGQLLNIRVAYSNIPLKITPEHPIWGIPNAWRNNWRCKYGGLSGVRLRWTPAKEMLKGSFIAFPRLSQVKDMEIITPNMAELLGWYVAEGAKDKNRGDGTGNRIVLSFNKAETSNIEAVTKMFAGCFGKEPIIRDRPTNTQIEYTDGAFANIFSEFGVGASKKKLAEWLFYLPCEKQFRFLRGYFHGDGYKSKNTHGRNIEATTISPKLAYGLRLLLFRLGILHSINKSEQIPGLIDGRPIMGNGHRYNILISGKAAQTLGEHIDMDFGSSLTSNGRALMNHGEVTKDYVLLPIRANEPYPFTGKVYNISVDADESYLTINGSVHNCGQSRHLLELEGLCEEGISMVSNPEIYHRIMHWVREIGPKTVVSAVESGKFDEDYSRYALQARDFRKELLGTLDVSALFPEKTPIQNMPATEETDEEERRRLLKEGFIA